MSTLNLKIYDYYKILIFLFEIVYNMNKLFQNRIFMLTQTTNCGKIYY